MLISRDRNQELIIDEKIRPAKNNERMCELHYGKTKRQAETIKEQKEDGDCKECERSYERTDKEKTI